MPIFQTMSGSPLSGEISRMTKLLERVEFEPFGGAILPKVRPPFDGRRDTNTCRI